MITGISIHDNRNLNTHSFENKFELSDIIQSFNSSFATRGTKLQTPEAAARRHSE